MDKFYTVMDLLHKYDLDITHFNEAFGEAMISLAYISFINPNSSISSKGYKVTPALLKYNQQHKQLKFLDKEEDI